MPGRRLTKSGARRPAPKAGRETGEPAVKADIPAGTDSSGAGNNCQVQGTAIFRRANSHRACFPAPIVIRDQRLSRIPQSRRNLFSFG